MTEIPRPAWKSSARVTKSRTPLSLERIVEAALGIIDAEGTEAVTMRRVAEELGTGAASLYAYVASREELLREVHERVIGEVDFPDFEALGWREAIREFARAVYAVYRSHSDIALLSFADVPTSPQALRGAESMLSAMIRDGVPPQVAAWALDRLSLYIAADAYEGWMLQKRFGGATSAEAEANGQAFFQEVAGFFAALPTDEFPTISANIDVLMNGDGEERFLHGIEMFIAGMASTIDTPA